MKETCVSLSKVKSFLVIHDNRSFSFEVIEEEGSFSFDRISECYENVLCVYFFEDIPYLSHISHLVSASFQGLYE